jgi:hypothetical protein
MLAVDDVADPAYGEPDGDARSSGIGRRADGDRPASKRRDEPAQDATDRRAPHRDAARPDLRDELGMRGVAADDAGAARPAVEDVKDARTDDPSDHSPRRDRGGIGLVDAELARELGGEPYPEEDADRSEDAVPRERDGAEVQIGIEVDGDQLASVHDIS